MGVNFSSASNGAFEIRPIRQRTLPRYKPNKKPKRKARKNNNCTSPLQKYSIYSTTFSIRSKRKLDLDLSTSSDSGAATGEQTYSSLESSTSSCPLCNMDEIVYCRKGSICSRRSKATIKSAKCGGKRRKKRKRKIVAAKGYFYIQ